MVSNSGRGLLAARFFSPEMTCIESIGTGAELADAVIWLAGDGAAYVSGCVLTVDGAFIAA